MQPTIIKQLATACAQHLQAQGYYPSGGLGWHWTGDPDSADYGKTQPGSWIYNVLPYLEYAKYSMSMGHDRSNLAPYHA